MALRNAGEFNSENGGKKALYENTYYSRTRFKNPDSKLQLGFQFKSGMLVIDIARQKEPVGFESAASIFITHAKAALLLDRIKEFEKYIAEGNTDPDVGFCINAGFGETVSVLILHLSEDGRRSVLVGKVNGSGDFDQSKTADYTFAKDYQYAITYNSIANKKISKDYLNDVEWEEFVTTVKQFYLNANGAAAYMVADITRFDTARILNKMNPIYEKLGIELRNGFNRNGSGTNSFFGGDNGGTSEHKSFDTVMDSFPSDDED